VGVAGNLVVSCEESRTTVTASEFRLDETAGGPATVATSQVAQRPSSKNLAPPHVGQVITPAFLVFSQKLAPL
jgi:hypothetical protein